MDELEVEVAKPGRFNAHRGGMVELDETALRDLADGFDPTETHKLKLGHEGGTAAPAYGTVLALRWDGFKKRLCATIRPVAELAQWIRESRFPDRSMELGRAGGRLTFKHLAFLGHAEPAIPGLAPIRLATAEGQTLCFSEVLDVVKRYEVNPTDRTQCTPASLAVHDLILEEILRAQAAGEPIEYRVAFERVASDPANRKALERWLGRT